MKMPVNLVNVPQSPNDWLLVILGFMITIPQGIIIFRDAQKRGRFPWLWGIWGLLSAPLPSIFYYIFVVRKDRKKRGEGMKKQK